MAEGRHISLIGEVEGWSDRHIRKTRALQADRSKRLGEAAPVLNARADGDFLEKAAALNDPARALLARAAEAGHLTARGWTRPRARC